MSDSSFTQCVLTEGHANCNLVLSMPYGLPRMIVLEAILKERLAASERILFIGSRVGTLAMLRHLWTARFPQYRIGLFAGDYRPGQKAAYRRETANILLYSVEKLWATLQKDTEHHLDTCRLVITDDLDLLTTPRGSTLEMALSTLLTEGKPQVVALAHSTNTDQIAAWLDAKSLPHKQYLTPAIIPVRDDTAREQHLLHLLAENRSQTIVFVRTPNRARNLAQRLCDLKIRAACHHSQLDTDSQFAVEQNFLAHQLDVVVATSSLAGISYLGAETVVAYDDELFDADMAQRTYADQMLSSQMAHASERAIILQSPRRPAIAPVPLALIPRECNPKHLPGTMLGNLAKSPNAMATARSLAPDSTLRRQALKQLIQQHLLTCQQSQLSLTPLGQIAFRSYLPLETVVHYDALIAKSKPLGFIDLLLLAALTPGFTPYLYVTKANSPALIRHLRGAHSRLLQGSMADILARLDTSPARLQHALKAALVARDLLYGHPITQVAANYQMPSAQVPRVLQGLKRLVPMLADLASLHASSEPHSTTGRARALCCLLSGLPVSAIELSYLDIPLERLLALPAKGYLTLSQVAQDTSQELADLVSYAQALLKKHPKEGYGAGGHVTGLSPIATSIDFNT